jgi:hypothetical protein
LYVLARDDSTNLCRSQPNLAALQLLPEARAPRFAAFWSKRAVLRDRYRSLIAAAAAEGRTIDLPVDILTDLVFGAVEATMTWYSDDSSLPPEEAAAGVAATAVRGILGRPPTPERLRSLGESLSAARATPRPRPDH